jgi:hypothetical protein
MSIPTRQTTLNPPSASQLTQSIPPGLPRQAEDRRSSTNPAGLLRRPSTHHCISVVEPRPRGRFRTGEVSPHRDRGSRCWGPVVLPGTHLRHLRDPSPTALPSHDHPYSSIDQNHWAATWTAPVTRMAPVNLVGVQLANCRWAESERDWRLGAPGSHSIPTS